MQLGQIISEYRRTHGLTLAQFEKASGISRSYLSVLERNIDPRTGNAIKPTYNMIVKAAAAMHVTATELSAQMQDGEHQDNLSVSEQLRMVTSSMTEEEILDVIDYAKYIAGKRK